MENITNDGAGSEDCKHTSGGVLVAIDSDVGSVIDEGEGAVMSFLGNDGRITQAWVEDRRSACFFVVYSWHSVDGRRE